MRINDHRNLNNFRNQKTLVLLFAYPTTKHFRKNVNKKYKNGDGGVGKVGERDTNRAELKRKTHD